MPDNAERASGPGHLKADSAPRIGNPKVKGASVLHATSILLIVYGAAALASGGFGMLGMAALLPDMDADGAPFALALIGAAVLAGGVLDFVAGLVGLRASKQPGGSMAAVVLGAIAALLALSGVAGSLSGDASSVWNAVLGLVLPGLYLWGAVLARRQP